jgi:hypothetical protein
MLKPIFLDKSKQPAATDLQHTLGSTFSLWKNIKDFIKTEIGDTTEDWKFYMKSSGWQLKTLLKKRNLFFFTPYKNCFRITFVFGDKAVAEAEKSDIPKSIINELLNAKKYMEGRGLSITVEKEQDVTVIKKLLLIKVKN